MLVSSLIILVILSMLIIEVRIAFMHIYLAVFNDRLAENATVLMQNAICVAVYALAGKLLKFLKLNHQFQEGLIMFTLANRVCVFEGATGNICRMAVKALAENGMNVVMLTHQQKKAEAVLEMCRDLPGKVIVKSNTADRKKILDEIEHEFGSIDVLINKTGGMDNVLPIDKISAEYLNEKLTHQITNTFNMIQDILPYLKKSSAPRIILSTTAGALDGFTGENLADSIARGGVNTMICSLARLLADDRITVNGIAMSGILTDHVPDPQRDLDTSALLDRIPLGHIGTAEELAALITYIASTESGFTTGHIFDMTGGIHVGR